MYWEIISYATWFVALIGATLVAKKEINVQGARIVLLQ